MHKKRGHINSVFSIDTDKIETSEDFDGASTSSQINLTTDYKMNFQSVLSEIEGRNERTRPLRSQVLIRRWSQNLTKFNKKPKKPSDNYNRTLILPSRNLFAVEGQLLASDGLEIDELKNEIEQNEELMEDNATAESLRIETIRALPHSLAIKKQIKEKLAISISRNSRRNSKTIFDIISYKVRNIFKYLSRLIRSNYHAIQIWYGSIKQIEGHFGSCVSTYFQFLRWLFILNLILLVFTLGFIVIPQILFIYLQDNRVFDEYEINNKSLKISDFFTGEGYLKKTLLFYGIYTNQTINLTSSNEYSLPYAYFMTMLCLYIFTFITVSISMARSYRRSFIETSGEVGNLVSQKVFCSWDFGISDRKAAELKHSSIYHELKEVLTEMNKIKVEKSKIWKFWILCSQLTAHCLVFAILIGVGMGMWTLLQNYGPENDLSPWENLYVAIAVNFTILILQNFFSWIAKMEDYSSTRRTLHVTLLRNFLLEVVVISVLVFFWLNKNHNSCWETSIGQEIYRLVIADFCISVLGTSFVRFIQVLAIEKIFPKMEKPEFDISRKSLNLVFNQTLLWVGLLFAPLLAIVVIIKMIFTFYIKKLTLLYLYKSSLQLWRSAQTQTLYLVITFLSLIGVFIILGYVMTQVPISQTCGPFRGNLYMFQIFIDGVLELQEHHIIWRIVTIFTRPAIMGGILLTMTVIVYYLRSKSHARIQMVKLLKEMLNQEAKDKEYLLQKIAFFTQDKEWLSNQNNDDIDEINENRYLMKRYNDNFAEASSTWKYKQQEKNTSY